MLPSSLRHPQDVMGPSDVDRLFFELDVDNSGQVELTKVKAHIAEAAKKCSSFYSKVRGGANEVSAMAIGRRVPHFSEAVIVLKCVVRVCLCFGRPSALLCPLKRRRLCDVKAP